MNKEILLVVLLGVLVLVAGVQAVALVTLNNAVQTGAVATGTGASNTGSTSNALSGIQSQQGGC